MADTNETKVKDEAPHVDDQPETTNAFYFQIKTEEVDVSDVEFSGETADTAETEVNYETIKMDPAEGTGSFCCDICSSSFRDESECTIHQNSVCVRRLPPVGDRLVCFACDKCQQVCATKGALKVHMRLHRGLKPSHRPRNSETLASKHELPYKCEICAKEFRWEWNLHRHKTVHTGLKPFECDICAKKFTHEKNLSWHLTIHTGLKPFQCDICATKFSYRQSLKKHMSSHAGVTPFQCEICYKKIGRKGDLKIHMALHEGLKPFQCEICAKKFSQKGNLNTHLATHTDLKFVKCGICDKKLSCKRSLQRHMGIHATLKPFGCEICDRKYSCKGDLKKHMTTHALSKPNDFEFVSCEFTPKVEDPPCF